MRNEMQTFAGGQPEIKRQSCVCVCFLKYGGMPSSVFRQVGQPGWHHRRCEDQIGC